MNRYKPGSTASNVEREMRRDELLAKAAARKAGGVKPTTYEYSVTLVHKDGRSENVIVLAKNEDEASEKAVRRLLDVAVVRTERVWSGYGGKTIDRRNAGPLEPEKGGEDVPKPDGTERV